MTHKTVQIGDYVSPGQLLFTIVPLDRVFVTANFKETQMATVRPGQRAVIHVDTYGMDFEGTVEMQTGWFFLVDALGSIAGLCLSSKLLMPRMGSRGVLAAGFLAFALVALGFVFCLTPTTPASA